ncbi:hypothetical protein PR048_024096 [Dryococelus australis]|uniref:Uncharacterized protein n=1 Tax=Dryococelus australis TaxID=614101 RepID=A0ABQ9GW02_9NEOP|nr:hypothetical protein PR048_024096 [Dryococelus australis]
MHAGRAVTINQLGKLYGAAFMKAASGQTDVNIFRNTGTHTCNPGVFPDWMFAPAETTNRPFDADRQVQQETPHSSTTPEPTIASCSASYRCVYTAVNVVRLILCVLSLACLTLL